MTKTIQEKPVETDWERIELDYRSGIKTLRQIADENNITHGAINKRAKRDNWSRDLSAKIKAKAEELVSKAAVSKEVSNEKKIAENEVVEANATMQADIILAHRTDIKRNRTLATKLLSELEQVSDNIDLFEKLSELIIDPVDDGDAQDKSSKAQQDRQYKRMEAFNRALDMSSRVDSLKKLSDTLKTLITLEREAFGLDERKNNDAQVTYNMQF
ncbi:MAG TPA: hypothetical protein VES38_06760 [Methylotenera sp.]|nr:hypothetical protein [Methylotenera sp.]